MVEPVAVLNEVRKLLGVVLAQNLIGRTHSLLTEVAESPQLRLRGKTLGTRNAEKGLKDWADRSRCLRSDSQFRAARDRKPRKLAQNRAAAFHVSGFGRRGK
jgi:hypothetical protein